MQIIWISGATSHYKKLSISQTQLLRIAGFVCFLMICIGSAIYFLGLRIAIQIDPSVARQMGGVVTAEQMATLEMGYRHQLDTLQHQLLALNTKVDTLTKIKDQFSSLATPLALKKNADDSEGGKGGPYLPFATHMRGTENLDLDMQKTLEALAGMASKTATMQAAWQKQYERLSALPSRLPLVDGYGLSSNYGLRNDPITNAPSFHPGIDFNTKVGSKVLAAGNGEVIRAEIDPQFGKVIEIKHAEGFTSLYAHCQRLLVKEGDQVARGQFIAESGNTGRSTGPHLHFSIYKNQVLVNPMSVLAIRNTTSKKED